MNLPADIVYEILSLLPAKSLGRFKVVCKDWYSHMHSRSFIAMHVKNQRANPKMLILQRHLLDGNYALSICSEEDKQLQDGHDIPTLSYQSKQQHYIAHDITKRFKMFPKLQGIKIIGTCNGIVCFSYGCITAQTITLWNPTTTELNTLPPFQLQCPPGTYVDSDYLGFGFDSTTDDYKVIRILYFRKREVPWPQEDYIIQIKIYSLSTNSCRDFDCSGLFATMIYDDDISLSSRNKSSWLARNFGDTKRNDEWFILSFDIGKEVFQKTPLPSEHVQFVRKSWLMKLCHMNDSVALVLYHGCYSERIYEIWTTKDLEEGPSSWIKLSSIGPISETRQPLGFWNCKYSNDLLFMFSSNYSVYKNVMNGIFMNNQGQIKNRPVPIEIKNIVSPRQVFSYTETLVSVIRS